MLILFEGVDKSGKTTLINNFVDLSKMQVFKSPIPPTAQLQARSFLNGYYSGLYAAVKKLGVDMIFDRSHITELAYAKIKRGYSPASGLWKAWAEENSHITVVVYVDTPTGTLKKRFVDDNEEYVKVREIDALKESYQKVMNKMDLSLVYIDGSKSKQNMLTQLVIQLSNLGVWTSKRSR